MRGQTVVGALTVAALAAGCTGGGSPAARQAASAAAAEVRLTTHEVSGTLGSASTGSTWDVATRRGSGETVVVSDDHGSLRVLSLAVGCQEMSETTRVSVLLRCS